uniref:Fork-head domain-containing protein n=1 Tax=Pelusios castaneus TaxID=367368 RepID=A0A8C8STC6_9SAUR
NISRSWLLLHPEDRDNVGGAVTLDDSLTSLQWLQDFSILTADPERPPGPDQPLHQKLFQGSEAPASPPAGDTAAKGMPLTLGRPTSAATSPGTSCLQLLPGSAEEIDYKNNPGVKPPYSYATLICMALQASKLAKLTLSAIYHWITENFCYYRHADPSWQNSIRHNLSLNKCFRKVPRQKDEPGKGGFWQIDPQYTDMFVNGVFKRRRTTAAPFRHAPYHAAPHPLRQQGQDPLLDAPGAPGPCKPSLLKRGRKAARTPQSPLLPPGGRDKGGLQGDFERAMAFDDVFHGNGSNFEDLDINAALSSLATEVDLAIQMQGKYVPPPGKLGAPATDHPGPGTPHEEDFPPFADSLRHPWEEALSNPWGFEQGYNFCGGFLSEMQPWDKADAVL